MNFCGQLFRQLSPMIASSVRMAIEGSSSPVGAAPNWLRRAVDLRVLGWNEGEMGSTVLRIEAPRLGEAAEEIYRQPELWDTKPAPGDTALNVFARAANQVRLGNEESSLYDLGLLKRFGKSDRLLAGEGDFMEVPESSEERPAFARLDREVAIRAQRLTEQTPLPRQVRLSGRLDMVRHSTRSFELLLEGDRPVRGVLGREDRMERMKSLLGKPVTIVGKAIYRPSGSVLRIDAEDLEEGAASSKLFAAIPPPLDSRVRSARIPRGDHRRNWMDNFFGTWPGSETDDELLRMLREVRG